MTGFSLALPSPSVSDFDDRIQNRFCKKFVGELSDCLDQRSRKRSSAQSDFEQNANQKPMSMDSCGKKSRVADHSVDRGMSIDYQPLSDGLSPSLVWACCRNKDLRKGARIHEELEKRGLVDKYCADALATMYAKCGEFEKAQELLELHESSNIIPWTALIAGYARDGHGRKALDCFENMEKKGIVPDKVTYVSVLKACALLGDTGMGKKVHDEIARQGFLEQHIVLGGALVDMYAKCGALGQAQSVLAKLPSRNLVCWNALIGGYAKNGQGQHALECFKEMQREGILPDEVTYICVVKACAAIGAVGKGKEIHNQIMRQGLLKHHIVLGGAIVDMYAKFGALGNARSVLRQLPSRNVVCWNALIAGYIQYGQGEQALDCLEEMQQEGILPNDVTYGYIIKACAAIGALDMGKKVHKEISRQGLLKCNDIIGSLLVEMYGKCGVLDEAQSVLEKLPSHSAVLYAALIAAYIENGQERQALNCFELMQHEGIQPNELIFVSVLKACGAIRDVEKGKKIHDQILRQGLLKHHILLGGALVDMYAKCGKLIQAKSVLAELPSRDVVSWGALIAGYAENGQGKQALDCFEQMLHESIHPDEVTLCCLLSVCSHLGLLEKGQELFHNMDTKYGVKPGVETFACMVDLFGRAGHLLKAVEVIKGMPFPANSAIWHCLLGACWKWVDVNVGFWAFERAVELDECDGPAYSLLKNIYVAAGLHEKAEGVDAMRIRNGACKS